MWPSVEKWSDMVTLQEWINTFGVHTRILLCSDSYSVLGDVPVFQYSLKLLCHVSEPKVYGDAYISRDLIKPLEVGGAGWIHSQIGIVQTTGDSNSKVVLVCRHWSTSQVHHHSHNRRSVTGGNESIYSVGMIWMWLTCSLSGFCMESSWSFRYCIDSVGCH